MSSLVLNKETCLMSIGDLLASATNRSIEITDEKGRLLATLVLNRESQQTSDNEVQIAELTIDDLRRRRSADHSRDVTTQELLRRASNAVREQGGG